jgi:hypothetical protein
MKKLFNLNYLKKFKNFQLWSDNGLYFKNNNLLDYYQKLFICPNINSLTQTILFKTTVKVYIIVYLV